MKHSIHKWFMLAVASLAQGCAGAGWGNPAVTPTLSAPPQTIEARKLVLLDSRDKPVAALGAAEAGSGLVLMDEKGKPRAAMVLTGNGEPGLKLYDAKGVVRAALVVGNDGRSGLAMYDDKGQNRAVMATDADGKPALMFFDRNGAVLATVPGPPTATPRHARTRSR